MAKKAGRWPGVFARGAMMGIAEVVPGVSGGTIAFVTGIYDELVTSIARFSPATLSELTRDGVGAVWRSHNLSFLAVLGIGMLTSVVLFARIMAALLEHHAVLVWGFFFGLIAASVVTIGRQLPWSKLAIAGALGAMIGVGVGLVPVQGGEPSYGFVFLGGALAISAWILPGISGSFVLLLLGLYQPILVAVNEFRADVLAVFVVGLAAGLLVFAKLLTWLLARVRDWLIASLTGFMAGSLTRLWPWRFDGELMTPAGYAEIAAEDPRLVGVVLLMGLGAVVVVALARMARGAVVAD